MSYYKIIAIAILVFIFIIALRFLIIYSSEKKKIIINDTERTYFVHLPSNYNPEKTYPVVFIIHGYSDHPKLIEFYTGFSSKADKESFITVYPQGTNDGETPQLSFNGEICCNPALKNNVDDTGFISTLIDEVVDSYGADPKKVFVTGFSNGGFMTQKLATEIPEKITAIAPVSSASSGRATKNTDTIQSLTPPNKAMPTLLIHGKKDRSVQYNGGYNQKETFEVRSAENTFDFWAKNNTCTKDRIATTNSKLQSTTYSFKDCSDTNHTSFISLDDIGHEWPGGRQFIFANLRGTHLKATDTIWDFFEKYI